MICNWGRADWCSWRRRGGRSGGGGGGGWPLSNGEGGGGGDAAAEGAGLDCATRRCHHCTGANSGGGAGSYFPLLPRCCFCRLGRRRRRRRRRRGREGGGGVAARSRGSAHTPAGAARCFLRCGAAAQFSPPRGPRLPGVFSFLSPAPPFPPAWALHPRVLRPRLSSPRAPLPGRTPSLRPGFPTLGSPPRRAGAAVVPAPGECSERTKKRAI